MDTPYILDRSVTRIAPDIGEYPGGIVIPVDKPYRWTSADVIRKIKFAAVRHFISPRFVRAPEPSGAARRKIAARR